MCIVCACVYGCACPCEYITGAGWRPPCKHVRHVHKKMQAISPAVVMRVHKTISTQLCSSFTVINISWSARNNLLTIQCCGRVSNPGKRAFTLGLDAMPCPLPGDFSLARHTRHTRFVLTIFSPGRNHLAGGMVILDMSRNHVDILDILVLF